MEMHPQGMLTFGTKSGNIVILEPISVLFQLEKTKKLKLRRKNYLRSIALIEHRDACYLLQWNNKGTMLFTGSEDGTARLWRWDINKGLDD